METVTHLTRDQVPATLRGAYTGTKFKAVACDTVTLQSTYWSGGTRSTWTMREIATGRVIDPNGLAAPPQFGGTLEGKAIEIPAGFAVVEHSIFCGKDHGLTFYVRPGDIAPLLPAPVALTDDELAVLAATATYKNSYGGRTDIRFAEASEVTGITRERWSAASASLTACGMLAKNGSITPAGRNACGSVRLGYGRNSGLRR